MKKTSRSYDQAKLKILCDDLCDNIESLLNSLDLEYTTNSKMISMNCPIHGGDNPGALNIYYQGDNYRGNWKCRTHNCEKHFKSSIIGFVRGVLSHNKHHWESEQDNCCSFDEAVDYCTKFLKKDLKSITISRSDREKNSFTNIVSKLTPTIVEKTETKISREQVRKSLTLPCEYFINRGFSSEILNKYDIGFCDRQGKEMYNRAVVPIYDNDHKFLVGCTGRMVFEKCDLCGSYHNPEQDCPEKDNKWKYSKWKHNLDFKSQNHLYNYWFAKNYILSSTTAILVESPGNVWRLEESGIHNSLAMFGSSLSDRQKMLLDSSGAMNIVILTDNDEAGKKAAEQIKQKCQNTYRIFVPTISKSDIGEMTIDEIHKEITPILERIV
jgi:5S rRNA maturation endonuclease (ribonuclease M5)